MLGAVVSVVALDVVVKAVRPQRICWPNRQKMSARRLLRVAA
jgi:hypothetical protein